MNFHLRITHFDREVEALYVAATRQVVYINEEGRVFTEPRDDRVRLLDPIDLLHYGVTFEEIDEQYGYWLKGEFQAISGVKSDALWVTIEQTIYDGNFDLLLAKLHSRIDLLASVSKHQFDGDDDEYAQYQIENGVDVQAILDDMR